jgi:peptide deformylase
LAIRPILKMGDPLLFDKAKLVTKFDTQELHDLIQDMIETMEAAEGAGLAAPQIGESIQLVIFGFDKNERYSEAEAIPFTVLINPVITVLDSEEENVCLSQICEVLSLGTLI